MGEFCHGIGFAFAQVVESGEIAAGRLDHFSGSIGRPCLDGGSGESDNSNGDV